MKRPSWTLILMVLLGASIFAASSTYPLWYPSSPLSPTGAPVPTATPFSCPAYPTPLPTTPPNREFPNASGALSSLQTADGLLGSAHLRMQRLFTSLPGEYNWEVSYSANEVLSAQGWVEQVERELQFWTDAGYFTCPSDYEVDQIRQETELSRANLEVIRGLLAGCETERCGAISQWLQEALYHQARADALILGKELPTQQP